MASPIGHALGGVFTYALDKQKKFDWPVLIISLFMAELPDIDFLFGYFSNEPNKYHHGFTHSFVFVIMIGVLIAVVTSWRHRQQFKRHALLFAGAGSSHIILDSLAKDTSAPYGAPIFWPFTDQYFISPVILLSDIHRAHTSSGFIASLFSMHNMYSVLRELMIMVPLIALVILINRKKWQA